MTGGPGKLSAHAPHPLLGGGMSAADLGRGTGLRAPRLLSTLVELEDRGHVHRLSGRPAQSDGLPRYQVPLSPDGGFALEHLREPRGLPAGWLVGAARSTWLSALVVLACAAVALHLSKGAVPVDLEVYRRGGSSVLHWTLIYEQPRGWLPFTYPPLAALAFTVLAALPVAGATAVGAVGSYAALNVVARLTLRHLRVDRAWAPAVVLAAAFLEPVAATVAYGQVNLVLAAMVLLDLLRPSRRWSGVLLGLAICIKLTPAIFLLMLLRRPDRPMLRRTLLTVAAGTVLPALLMPASSAAFWFHALWDPQRVGGLAYAGNQSLTGSIWRLTGPGGSPTLTYLLSLAALVLLLMGLRRPDADRLTQALACAFTGLLISPVSWSHHWVWIIPAMVCAAHATTRFRQAGALLAGAWLVAALTRLIWAGPHGGDLEYTASLPLLVATDAYTVLGVATLALLITNIRTQHHRPPAAARAPELLPQQADVHQ